MNRRAGRSGLALPQGSIPKGGATKEQWGLGTAPMSPLPDGRPQRGGARPEGRKWPNILQPRKDPRLQTQRAPAPGAELSQSPQAAPEHAGRRSPDRGKERGLSCAQGEPESEAEREETGSPSVEGCGWADNRGQGP